jgi:dephospho-CoA kinase
MKTIKELIVECLEKYKIDLPDHSLETSQDISRLIMYFNKHSQGNDEMRNELVNILNNKKMNKQVMKIGITGDLGSGKTYISELFAKKGIPTYNCDLNSKILVLNDVVLKMEIKKYFGENIYEGNIFKNLSDIAFDDDEKRTNLNILTGLIYPFLFKDIEKFCQENTNALFVLIESAVLYENKMDKDLDGVIFVDSNRFSCLKRAKERNGMTEQQYDARMKYQLPVNDKKTKSSYIINNEYNSHSASKVESIFNSIKNRWVYEGEQQPHNDVY